MVFGVLPKAGGCDVLQIAVQRCPRKKPVNNELKVSAVQNKALRKLLLCKPIS